MFEAGLCAMQQGLEACASGYLRAEVLPMRGLETILGRIKAHHAFMFVLEPTSAGAARATLWLRPNRSLSRRGLRRWMGALGVWIVAVAVLSARAGNIYAPLFALVEVALVVYALSRAWHAGDRSERITIDARSLEVERLPGRRRTCFQSYWVRVSMRSSGHRQHLVLTSHGGELEIGAFLGEEERADVLQTLRMLLAEKTALRQDH